MGKKKRAAPSNPARGFATTSTASKAQVAAAAAAKEEQELKAKGEDETVAVEAEEGVSGDGKITATGTVTTSGGKGGIGGVTSTSTSTTGTGKTTIGTGTSAISVVEAQKVEVDLDALPLFALQQQHSPTVQKTLARLRASAIQRGSKPSYGLKANELLSDDNVISRLLSEEKQRLDLQVRRKGTEVGIGECWVVWEILRGEGVSEGGARRGVEWWVKSGREREGERGAEEVGVWLVAGGMWSGEEEGQGDDGYDAGEEEREERGPRGGRGRGGGRGGGGGGGDGQEQMTQLEGVLTKLEEFEISDEDDEDAHTEDSLLSTYLRLQTRLFLIHPSLAPAATSYKKKASAQIPTVTHKSVKRLLEKVRRVYADPVLDQKKADLTWAGEVQRLVREGKGGGMGAGGGGKNRRRRRGGGGKEEKPAGDEEGGLMGGLFDGDGEGAEEPVTKSIPVRDFEATAGPTSGFGSSKKKPGQTSTGNGRAAVKVLEEILQNRQPQRPLTAQNINSTASSSQAEITFKGGKYKLSRLDSIVLSKLNVSYKTERRGFKLFMNDGFAAANEDQALGYIATVAMWLLLRETKTYTRLVGVWKSVWNEILEVEKVGLEDDERRVIGVIKGIVEKYQPEEEESEGEREKKKREVEEEKEAGMVRPVLSPEDAKALWEKTSGRDSFARMLEGRKQLPMWSFRDQVLSAIQDHQVILICGETGCGKSTQVPSFLLENALSNGVDPRIYVTEPRRISALSLARRVSEELGERKNDVGTRNSLVGYAIRLESKTTPETKLIYATTGIVMRLLERDQELRGVTHLVLDEVHERSIDSDFLLIVLKKLMWTRPDLKVILMSATVDADKFSDYLGGCPILYVPGRTYPVQTFFLEDAIENSGFELDDRQYYTKYGQRYNPRVLEDMGALSDDEVAEGGGGADTSRLGPGYSPRTVKVLKGINEARLPFDLIIQLLETMAQRDEYIPYSNAVLVFLPGIAEIRRLNDLLRGHHEFNPRHGRWLVYALHSTIASDDQEAAFLRPPPGMRKIVLATNIAETGITIPDVTCVIDTGRHKEMRFDERRQISRLVETFISRANAKQRRGRAGRVQEGICWHLFTRSRFETRMMEQQSPEMLRLSLQDLALRVKMCSLGGIEETLAKALDPPSPKNIRSAVDALTEAKALTPSEELTLLGRRLAKLPLDIYLGKLVLSGIRHSAVDATITIAAILSSKTPFQTPMGDLALEAEKARLQFAGDSCSDLIAAWNAYQAWRRVFSAEGFASAINFSTKMYLVHKNLLNIEDLKLQLYTQVTDEGLLPLPPTSRQQLSISRSSSNSTVFFYPPKESDRFSTSPSILPSLLAHSFAPKLLYRPPSSPWTLLTSPSTHPSFHPSSILSSIPGTTTSKSHFCVYTDLLRTSASKKVAAVGCTLLRGDTGVLIFVEDVEIRVIGGGSGGYGGAWAGWNVGVGGVRWRFAGVREAVGVMVLKRKVAEVGTAGCAWALGLEGSG